MSMMLPLMAKDGDYDGLPVVRRVAAGCPAELRVVACALRGGASGVCLSAARQSVARPTIICALVELYVASATFLSSKMGCFARLPQLDQFGALTCCTGM